MTTDELRGAISRAVVALDWLDRLGVTPETPDDFYLLADFDRIRVGEMRAALTAREALRGLLVEDR